MMDSGIVSHLTSFCFCIQDNVPRHILEEGLSLRGLNLSISLDCGSLSCASIHILPITISSKFLEMLDPNKETKMFKIGI